MLRAAAAAAARRALTLSELQVRGQGSSGRGGRDAQAALVPRFLCANGGFARLPPPPHHPFSSLFHTGSSLALFHDVRVVQGAD